jgi:hypothetical protein
MKDQSTDYTQIGMKVAMKGVRFPGLGQLSNGETFKGTVVIALFSFSLALCSKGPVLAYRCLGDPSAFDLGHFNIRRLPCSD